MNAEGLTVLYYSRPKDAERGKIVGLRMPEGRDLTAVARLVRKSYVSRPIFPQLCRFSSLCREATLGPQKLQRSSDLVPCRAIDL
jgi:hypothetical protein